MVIIMGEKLILMKIPCLLLLTFLQIVFGAETDSHNMSVTKLTNAETTQLLDELVTKMDYRVRPNVDGDSVKVYCGLHVISFGSISELNMEYNMAVYLRQEWHDARLTFTSTTKPLTMNSHLLKHMWTPDLYFPAEKRASFHEVTVPNKLMRVYPDGRVVYSIRLTLTLACPMDLTHYPMDYQECDFMLESYSYTLEDLHLQWFQDEPIEFEDNIELPQFDLIDVRPAQCDAQSYKTGSFPCVKCKFKLKRQYGFHLLQTYIPSILIVVISWLSFWINIEAVPARISLGVTTVLTMTTQLSGSKASIPRISYPKAIDIWMAMCMVMVFGALIEYAFVNALSRKEKKRVGKCKKTDEDNHKEDELCEQINGSDERKEQNAFVKFLKANNTAANVDKLSRIIFPLSFLIFNLIYWPYFTLPHF